MTTRRREPKRACASPLALYSHRAAKTYIRIVRDFAAYFHRSPDKLGPKEFEASLESARNRYRGYYGAAKAEEKSGNQAKAKGYFEKLVALCNNSDTPRPELLAAKQFLTND